MEFSELKTGQPFIIRGVKIQYGFITADGKAHYGIDGNTIVEIAEETQKKNYKPLSFWVAWLEFGMLLAAGMLSFR